MSLGVGNWTVDRSRSTVGFQVRHIGFATATGRFGAFAGTMEVDSQGEMSASGAVQVASVETGDSSRNEFLISTNFFDAERCRELTFISKQVRPGRNGGLRIAGDLTIRGVTRSVVFDASPQDPEPEDGQQRASRSTSAARLAVRASDSRSREPVTRSWATRSRSCSHLSLLVRRPIARARISRGIQGQQQPICGSAGWHERG